jgi:cytochrome P450
MALTTITESRSTDPDSAHAEFELNLIHQGFGDSKEREISKVLEIKYDPLDPATLSDPYPIYAQMRSNTPVYWHETMQSWVLTRYRDCVDVLRNYELFARDRTRVGGSTPAASLSVQSLDPPDQTSLRSMFMNAFRAQDLEAIKFRARSLIERNFDQHCGIQFDVLTDLAAPLSLQVISDLLGVEQPELASFVSVSNTIMRSMDVGLNPEMARLGEQARQQLSTMVESWFLESGRTGMLANIQFNQQKSFHHETRKDYVRNTTRVMFQGGYSTTVAAIGNVILILLKNPGVLKQMREPGLLETGVDELLRFEGPVQGTSRVAVTATTIGDTEIDCGQTVLTLLGAANHDPEQFPNPDILLLERNPNRHLGFGWGPHSCIGTMLAQITIQQLVAALLDYPNRLTLAGSPRWRRTATMRTLESFPVAFAI